MFADFIQPETSSTHTCCVLGSRGNGTGLNKAQFRCRQQFSLAAKSATQRLRLVRFPEHYRQYKVHGNAESVLWLVVFPLAGTHAVLQDSTRSLLFSACAPVSTTRELQFSGLVTGLLAFCARL
jgi:hypothetical protein